MATALERWYASGGSDYLIPTLEIKRDSAESLFLCAGFEEVIATDENGRTITFEPSPLDVALRKRDNSGNQSLTFGFQNVTTEVMRYADAAREADEEVRVIYRAWLSSDLSAPAEPPVYMTATDVGVDGAVATVETGHYDVINTGVNRTKYRADKFPGIRYAS